MSSKHRPAWRVEVTVRHHGNTEQDGIGYAATPTEAMGIALDALRPLPDGTSVSLREAERDQFQTALDAAKDYIHNLIVESDVYEDAGERWYAALGALGQEDQPNK